MNLIEQLGGYDKAKAKADELDYDLNNLDFLGGGSARESMYERLDSIEKALLQYRRENNIFEVGDLCKLSVKCDYGLYKFLRMRDGRVSLEDRLGFAEFWIAAGVVSHATDEEIKANKREVG